MCFGGKGVGGGTGGAGGAGGGAGEAGRGRVLQWRDSQVTLRGLTHHRVEWAGERGRFQILWWREGVEDVAASNTTIRIVIIKKHQSFLRRKPDSKSIKNSTLLPTDWLTCSRPPATLVLDVACDRPIIAELVSGATNQRPGCAPSSHPGAPHGRPPRQSPSCIPMSEATNVRTHLVGSRTPMLLQLFE